jgi:hypothetical protein
VIGLGLRQLQDALNRKANAVQREFLDLSERLDTLSKELLEARGADREPLRAKQQELRVRQTAVAEDVNLWRQRARGVLQQRGGGSLRAYIEELMAIDDEEIRAAATHALYLMDAPPEELEKLIDAQAETDSKKTPASRLLERSRTEYDLRGTDPAARLRAAVEFANRPGLAMDLDTIVEIEAAMDDADPLVREVALHTTLQLHRFRAMRTADLEVAHQSVLRLAQITHPAAIPVLIEMLETHRTGYIEEEGATTEADNGRSRLVALLRLVEWHTPEAQSAVRARKFDRDSNIVKAAERALQLFPGEWSTPLKKTGRLS